MSHVLRWNPFRDIEEVLDRYNRVYGLANPVTVDNAQSRELLTRADWQPAVDIIENDQEFLVKAELPDVQKENVKVNVDKGVLTISGERRLEKAEGDVKHRRIERVFGNFARRFTLPEDVDENGISAEYKDGVLSLRIPKVAKVQPKPIEVKVH